jgi:hypothetical protein
MFIPWINAATPCWSLSLARTSSKSKAPDLQHIFRNPLPHDPLADRLNPSDRDRTEIPPQFALGVLRSAPPIAGSVPELQSKNDWPKFSGSLSLALRKHL